MCMYVLVLPDNIRQKCLSMKCRYVHVLHVFCQYVIGICRYLISMGMYVHVLPDNIRQKCLSMKCRYVHVLHVFCLYLVGMCRYGILCTLKFVMTVSLGGIHHDDNDY